MIHARTTPRKTSFAFSCTIRIGLVRFKDGGKGGERGRLAGTARASELQMQAGGGTSVAEGRRQNRSPARADSPAGSQQQLPCTLLCDLRTAVLPERMKRTSM